MSEPILPAGLHDDVVDLATLLSDWSMEQDDPSRRHRVRRAAAALMDLIEED